MVPGPGRVLHAPTALLLVSSIVLALGPARAAALDVGVDLGARRPALDASVAVAAADQPVLDARVSLVTPVVEANLDIVANVDVGSAPPGATADVGLGVGAGRPQPTPTPPVPSPPSPTGAVPNPPAPTGGAPNPPAGGAPQPGAPDPATPRPDDPGRPSRGIANTAEDTVGGDVTVIRPADRAAVEPGTAVDSATPTPGDARSAEPSPPPSVTASTGGGDDLGTTPLPAAIAVLLAGGIAATGAVMSIRGRPIPGAGMLSVAFGAIAVSQLPDLFLGEPVSGSWRARLELAVLAVPPWAIARQVRLLTRTPTSWLRLVDASALALVAWVLVSGGTPTADAASSAASIVLWTLAVVLVLAAWMSVRCMLRANRRHDPRIARMRATAMEWIVAIFLAVYVAWVAAPIESSAFFVASIGMLLLSTLLTLVAVLPRPLAATLDRIGNRSMARSIETLVGANALRPVLATVMDGFADGLGVDGIAFVEHGRVIEFGGRCAMRRDRGPAAEPELLEDAGATRLVAWPNRLSPPPGRQCRERMRVAARLLQAACDRDRLLAVEREAIETATETATALASANRTLRETNEIKGEFVSSVSHELRTPLTSIVGLARTAHDRWDDLDEDRLRDFQRIIAEQGERLTQLVNELLLIGRIEEGHLTIDVADVDLALAAEQAILDAGIDDGPIHVVLPTGVTRLRTDRMLLHEVLVNYLSNAHKYGAPPIELRFSRRHEELEVTVSDRGEPVAAEFREQLFERFTRARSVVGRQPGTGLGLAIVQEVSQKLGGSAWYEPNPGGGNRFCARFRVGWVESADVAPRPEPARPGGATFASRSRPTRSDT